MTNKTAASRYARALFDVAVQEHADLEAIGTELAAFNRVIASHRDLEKVLLNPAVPVTRKRAAVEQLAARGKMSSIVSKLLALLADRDRLVLLPDLLAAYNERVLDYRKVVRAEVTTATPLAPERARELEQKLVAVTGRSVLLNATVDPSIIGGLVAKVGSTVYDASVTRQLEKMKTRLAESV